MKVLAVHLRPFADIFIFFFIIPSKNGNYVSITAVLLSFTVILPVKDGTTKLHNCSADRMIFRCHSEPNRR